MWLRIGDVISHMMTDDVKGEQDILQRFPESDQGRAKM